MITGFAIILDDGILYISNKKKHAFFEIVLFIEKLIKNINPHDQWRLTNIYFEGDTTNETMIIKHLISEEEQNLFFCITGEFLANSIEANKCMQEFYEKVIENYSTAQSIKKASQRTELEKVVKLITAFLWKKYNDNIEDEKLIRTTNNITNKIIYCGLSAQGLPIISKLYDESLVKCETAITKEEIDIFSSKLSAKLATISMNTQIRAKSNIKEIHFQNLKEDAKKQLILYGNIDGYSLDLIATGDYSKIKDIFKKLENRIANETILKKEFEGDLKPFRALSVYLDEIITEFDH
jgi:hypothetical protein